MIWFLIMFSVAMIISAIGFKKYVYFISLGYGFSVSGIAITTMILGRDNLIPGTIAICILLWIYGVRLGGYLLIRELKSASYRKAMKNNIKDGKNMKIGVKIAIWVTCALLYSCQTAPIYFRLREKGEADTMLYVGIGIMAFGVIFESISDLQKNNAKKKNPDTFVRTGLFSFVRCPNYLGEMIFWTGVLVSGIGAFSDPVFWTIAILGYLGIIYVMFSGARRLELRQNKNYGNDPEYQAYVKKTPIMVPFIPLYSVASQKWLVG